MSRHLRTAVGLVLLATTLQLGLPGAPAGAADSPSHSVVVSGAGVSTYPAYAAGIDRYAVRTTTDTAGTVDVTATTSDPDGTIFVNGTPAANGQPLEVAGLEPGDEVAVAIDDAAGSSRQAFIYLPAGFPALSATGTRQDSSTPYVFLGLGSFLSKASFQTVVDANGVPVYVRETLEPHDFRPQPAGPAYTVFEPVKDSPDDQEYGYRVLELDDQFHQTGVRRFTPLPDLGITPDDTDFHDVEYLADGRVVLVGYHRDFRAGGPWLDAVIEIVEPDGSVDFVWDSKDEVDPSEGYVFGGKGQDYAHINSVQMQPNGDLLASFRNLGQVMRIATTAHDGFAPGDVVWRMGGKRNEFTFLDDPAGGFCAQHDARLLPNGHLTLFDNGSRHDAGGPIAPQTADMCPDPAGPGEPRTARPQTRVVEYDLDDQAHTARLVWSYQVAGRYAPFAGNAQRLPGGDTLVGWSDAENNAGPEPAPIASEVTPAGDEAWSLAARGWFSYRAVVGAAPDRIAPEIEVDETPGQPTTWSCSDRGGSTLQTCAITGVTGGRGTAGRRQSTITATDGAGNSTRRTFGPADPLPSAELTIRRPGGSWGAHRVRLALAHAGDRATTYIRVRNLADLARFDLRAKAGNRDFAARYFHGSKDVTDSLLSGHLRTPTLRHAKSWKLRVVIRRTAHATSGDRRVFHVLALSDGSKDHARAVVRAR